MQVRSNTFLVLDGCTWKAQSLDSLMAQKAGMELTLEWSSGTMGGRRLTGSFLMKSIRLKDAAKRPKHSFD
jgi:hypothetical protein